MQKSSEEIFRPSFSVLIYCKFSIRPSSNYLSTFLPIQQRLEYKICLLIFKCLHQTAPVYLRAMSDTVSASASRSHLWSAARGDLAIPWSRTTTDKEVFRSLVHHCGTRCRSLFGTHLWQWRSSAHIWIFCFTEYSIAPSWQFTL